MRIVESETCTACNSGAKDYIEHFFFACEKVTALSDKVQLEIKQRTNKTLFVNENTALVGYHDVYTTDKAKTNKQ